MSNREILYQSYYESHREIQSEEISIDNLDNINKTKYLKQYQKGKITAEEVARLNHEAGLLYELVILEEDLPAYYLQIIHENEFIGVNFLDNVGREYLTYHFLEVEAKKQLFLREAWYRFYPNDEATEPNYRIHFAFDRDGNVAYRKYDEIAQKASDYESKEPLDVSGLYEPYPEFGNYESIIRLERDIYFMDDVISSQE